MVDWVDKIREPLDLKRAASLKVQVMNYLIIIFLNLLVICEVFVHNIILM